MSALETGRGPYIVNLMKDEALPVIGKLLPVDCLNVLEANGLKELPPHSWICKKTKNVCGAGDAGLTHCH
jgi:hypothetical protein